MKRLFLVCLSGLLLPFQSYTQLTLDWANFIKGDNSVVNEICFDPSGNIIDAGLFQLSADFDPGPETLLFNAGAGYNAFLRKSDAFGRLLWAKRIAGPIFIRGLKTDGQGNIILTGVYQTGMVIGPLTLQNNTGISGNFIAKIAPDGNPLWLVHVINPNFFRDLTVDSQGNSYILGTFRDSMDFNPAPNATHWLYTDQTAAMYVLKLDPGGNFLWASSTQEPPNGSNSTCNGFAIEAWGDHIYLTGELFGAVDFDPGPGAQILDPQSFRNAFVEKMDASGALVWVKHITGTGIKTGTDLDLDPNGNVYVVGNFSYEIDLDPGPGVVNHSSVGNAGNYDFFTIKLNNNGEFIWGKKTGSYFDQFASEVEVDAFGNVYTAGEFTYSADFNPGTGTFDMTSGGGKDWYVQKLDVNGNFLEAKKIGGTVDDELEDMLVDPYADLLLAGSFKGAVDFDPNNGVFFLNNGTQTAGFMTKLRQPWNYTGKVFRDLNQNQIQDAGEPGMRNVILTAQNRDIYAGTDTNGVYRFFANLTNDVVKPIGPVYWNIAPPSIQMGAVQTGHNFAIDFPLVRDVAITLVELTPFRPGFNTSLLLQVKNVGTVDLDTVSVRLKFVQQPSPALEILTIDPAPFFNSGNELRWLLQSLAVGQTRVIRIEVKTPVAPIGQPVLLTTSAQTADDIDSSNNGFRLETITQGSYDPNDKRVTPALVAPASVDTTNLYYVVRFQNTGTLPADFVVIRDTISPNLDLATLQVLAASHHYTWRLLNHRVLEVRFDAINLPDSTSNEPESHGFVLFSIQPIDGLPLGKIVKNRAGIYFDFNPPIITNTTEMRVGSLTKTWEPEHQSAPLFRLIPNPAAAGAPVQLELLEAINDDARISVYDARGSIVFTKLVPDVEKQIQLNDLPPGAYFVELLVAGRKSGQLFIVQ